MKKSVLVGAVVAVLGLANATQAALGEAGDFFFGVRAALNYSAAEYPYYTYNDGGFGFEGGLHCLYTFEKQIGLHVGANFIYRNPIEYRLISTPEMAVGIPIVVQYNPFMLRPNRTAVEDRIFIELGLQPDILLSSEMHSEGKKVRDYEERTKFDLGLIVGFVFYFNGNVAMDLRYYLGFLKFDTISYDRYYGKPYLYQANLGFRYLF